MKRTLALVAHDNKKLDLVAWANRNKETLKKFTLVATSGTKAQLLKVVNFEIQEVLHGPDGGDVHIAFNIQIGKIDALVFFIDARTAHGHEHDIQTLIRTCVTHDLPFALNGATATAMLPELLEDDDAVRRNTT